MYDISWIDIDDDVFVLTSHSGLGVPLDVFEAKPLLLSGNLVGVHGGESCQWGWRD